ncbi:iron complex outermembrane receptor protein [Neolewinella xylanilytica]|uniref:Iron complex outermembrane receptor protein n=1 Tax=Neolewinella xylanilytica TaxID=1514080 RepID=A0A2S6I8C8_9BACT|nr:SusC/RagA family TonB-linked outer membrane protein [Neolewinella xylanilytica]PPK87743.1 iron complex outermembrane receptor protein [Neolewinella xylanilytica]
MQKTKSTRALPGASVSCFSLPHLLSFGFFLLLSVTGRAQTVEVSGTVTDGNGEALVGVSVFEKDNASASGTVTDLDGSYSLSVPPDAVLIFSYVGFGTEEIPVQNRTTIDVTLGNTSTNLNEVVVIGYGTTERQQVTSSVASIDEAQFNKGNVNNPLQFLQGKVAGLSINRSGSDPNGGFAVRLRGLSTFGANASPLIIIDGVQGGNLELVDPNDIASIDVLKDGSAAAIYGSRGSSGVIIVTTKKGREGTRGVTFDAYGTIDEIARSVPIASAERFVEEGGTDLGYDTDWLDLVTRTGVSQTYNLALNGSSAESSYRLSVNYRDQEGIARNSGFNQFNTRLNLNHSVLDSRLNFTGNVSVNIRNASFVPYEALGFALISNPTAPVYVDNDPELGYLEPNTTEFHNPVAIMEENTREGKYKTMLGSIRADYELLEGLTASAFYSLQYRSEIYGAYATSAQRFGGFDGLQGRADRNSLDEQNSLFELTGSYKKRVGRVDLNIVGGYTYQELITENFNVFNTGFITDELGYNNLDFGLGINSEDVTRRGFDSGKGQSLLASFFGRALVSFEDTYSFTAAYRREGSSRFGANNRWGNFYSLSAGVDLAKALNIPMDRLKLRAGYGVTGNLPTPFYAYRVLLSNAGTIPFNDGNAERNIRLFNYASNPNPDLKWEQKAETNIGIDFALFDYRLTGSIDAYTRNSTDLLFNQPVSQPPNFFGSTLLNLGELESKGLELVVDYNVINQEALAYTTGITFSTNKTTIISLNEDSQVFFGGNPGPPGLNGTNVIRAAVGEELGQIQAPRFLGLDADGNRQYEELTDLDGNGAIERFNDWPIVGNALPDFELAWNNSLTFGNFDFSATFRGAFGHSIANISRAYYEVPDNVNNYNLVITDFYLPDMVGNEEWSDYYVEKADYVKLDNAALGYNFDLGNSSFRQLRVYVATQNPIVISSYTGVDPEPRIGDALYPGVEYRNNYFRSRSYTIGVKVGL